MIATSRVEHALLPILGAITALVLLFRGISFWRERRAYRADVQDEIDLYRHRGGRAR